MEKGHSKPTLILSVILIVLSLAAAAGGLLITNLYRDNDFARAAWFGGDLVTVFLAVPTFSISLLYAKRGSKKAKLVSLGMIYYTLYNFSFYLFGAALNRFFPIYAALFTLSVYALIFGILEIDLNTLGQNIQYTAAIRFVSYYMLLWASFLFITWIGQWANFTITGTLPAILVSTGGSNLLIADLDLPFIVSALIMSVIWLWRRRPIGYVLSIILNVSGTVYVAVLIAGSFVGAVWNIKDSLALIPVWIFLAIGCLVSSVILLKAYPSDVGKRE